MRISRSLYRSLLRLCPPDFRAEFGAEMEDAFAASLAGARGVHKIAVWLRALGDLVRHGTGARHDAWRRFRNTSGYVEYRSGGWWMDTFRHDLRHAARAIARQPVTSMIVIFTLALAIGANTAVFSAVHTALLRQLPYIEPDALVQIYEKRPAEGVFTNSVSPADYQDWAQLSTSFSVIAAALESAVDLTGSGEPERLNAASVTASFFDVFGVRALHGRTFAAGEDTTGRNRVVVLEHGLWQQRFGGDPSIVGSTIQLNDIPNQVIGVLPPDARFPIGEARLFVPVVLQPTPERPPRASHYLTVVARLKPGVAIEQARAEMDRIGRDLEAQYPDLSRGHGSHVVPLAPEMVKGVRSMLLVLSAAVAFIMLIAWINVTNLLLASTAGRNREMAVRAAIGAGRTRLLRQMLVETSLLATIGGVAGMLVAYWGVQLLATQMPPTHRPHASVLMSMPVLLFTAGACVLSGLLAGILPAWHLVGSDPATALKEGGRSPVALRRRLRFGLIVAEIACTTLLLVGAGLTLRSFRQVLMEPAGIETAERLTFNIRLPRARYATPESFAQFFGELARRIADEPAVRRVGATSSLPLTPGDPRYGIVVDGYERGPEDGPTRAHPRAVTPGYLSAVGMRIVEGRALSDADRHGPKVVVINETMARRYWRSGSALGGRVRMSAEQDWREVVGVSADVKHWGLDAPVAAEMYIPLEQFPQQAMWMVVESAATPASLVPVLTQHVRQLDPNLPLSNVRTFDDVAARSVGQRRFTMMLLASFAVLALVLAAAGIYGVMAHLVSLRTPEIGVRLTLGARPGAVMRQVLGEGALQAGIGLIIGLAASFTLMRGMRAILFGIEPTDPVTLGSVGVSLMLVALLAVLVPAVRAMRVDPITALRQ